MAYNYEWPYTDPNRYNDDWILKTVKETWEKVNTLDEWIDSHQKEYDELKKLYEDIVKGNFPLSMLDALTKWVKDNAISLIGEMVKNVFFGLSEDGYFVAYIPESWQEIIFNTTGLDITITDQEYGRLVLSY